MKNILRISVVLVILAGVGAATNGYGQSLGGGRLTGAWDTAVTIYNCSNGATLRQFASLGTFQQGGTYTGITGGMPPSARSPELGVWKHTTGNNYTFRFKAFLFDPTGAPTGYQVVTHQIELGADNSSYLSDGGVQIFNTAGVQVGTGCSSAVGTRMDLD